MPVIVGEKDVLRSSLFQSVVLFCHVISLISHDYRQNFDVTYSKKNNLHAGVVTQNMPSAT
jgi:hypothetical protein